MIVLDLKSSCFFFFLFVLLLLFFFSCSNCPLGLINKFFVFITDDGCWFLKVEIWR